MRATPHTDPALGPRSALPRAALPRAALPRAALPLIALLITAGPALAGAYEFAPAPQIDLNRVYRVDKFTGEVTSCQYGLREGAVGSVGVTVCYGSGEGAGAQAPSDYGLVASRHAREAGVFRVNNRTGEMSICYVQVQKEAVVCTAQAGPAASGADEPAIGPTRPAPSATPPQGGRP